MVLCGPFPVGPDSGGQGREELVRSELAGQAEDPTLSTNHPPARAALRRRPAAAAEALRGGEAQRRVIPVHHQPGNGLRVRVVVHVVHAGQGWRHRVSAVSRFAAILSFPRARTERSARRRRGNDQRRERGQQRAQLRVDSGQPGAQAVRPAPARPHRRRGWPARTLSPLRWPAGPRAAAWRTLPAGPHRQQEQQDGRADRNRAPVGCAADLGQSTGVCSCGAHDNRLVGFQNSASGLDLGFYAARSYSLKRPPRRVGA